MEISSKTHSGLVRKNNEDACLIIPPWDNISIEGKICMFIVADGMGGQNAGEVASAIAIDSARKWLISNQSEELSEKFVEDMVVCANQDVWEYAQKHSEATGMGTTFTALLISDSKAFIGHIGDSRAYRIRDNKLEQISRDHSLVAEQVRMGKLTPEAARKHPTRHILSRVIGGRQFIQPDAFEIEVKNNDKFFLCSDGIYGMIEDHEIEKIINENGVKTASIKLVEAANNNGGKDNSTCIIVQTDAFPIAFPSKYSLSRIKETLSHWGEVGYI